MKKLQLYIVNQPVIIMVGFEGFLIGWRKQTTQTSCGGGGKGCCLYIEMYSNKGVVTKLIFLRYDIEFCDLGLYKKI